MPGTYEKFPYTNFHGMNLDWICQKMVELEEIVNTGITEKIDERISQLFLDDYYDPDTETLTITLVLPPTP